MPGHLLLVNRCKMQSPMNPVCFLTPQILALAVINTQCHSMENGIKECEHCILEMNILTNYTCTREASPVKLLTANDTTSKLNPRNYQCREFTFPHVTIYWKTYKKSRFIYLKIPLKSKFPVTFFVMIVQFTDISKSERWCFFFF